MRNAPVTLSGASLLASLILSACVIKNPSWDDGNAGNGPSSGGSDIVVRFSGGQTGSQGGSTTETPNAGGATGIAPPPCEGLLEQLKTDPTQVCNQTNQAAKFTKINMLIVLDKSGSMDSTPAGYTRSKWAVAIDALKKSLLPNDTLISYGIVLYPYAAPVAATRCEVGSGQDAVNVPVGPAVDTVPEINDLMAATGPGGGTPTAAALGAALDYYTKGGGIGLEGLKYVLLVTDGGPNCNADIACSFETCTAFMDKSPSLSSCWDGGVPNCCDISLQVADGLNPQALCLDDLAVTSRLDALRSARINTFVIGIPGSEAYKLHLDNFAQSGGEPVVGKARKYYEVTGESGLADAFKAITTELISSCTVQLNKAPPDTSEINVAIDCSPLPQKTGEQTNWSYDGTNNSIVIEGVQCERIKATGVNRIDIVNGCPTIILQ